MPEILFDCCCLSNFALSDSLSILKSLYSNSAYITEFVSAEIMRGIQRGHKDLAKIQDSLSEGWLKEAVLINEEEKSLYKMLSVSHADLWSPSVEELLEAGVIHGLIDSNLQPVEIMQKENGF